MIHCILALDYEDEEMASMIEKAVGVDNEGFVSTFIRGAVMEARMTAGSIPSLLQTINDFLRCSVIAENAVKLCKNKKIRRN